MATPVLREERPESGEEDVKTWNYEAGQKLLSLCTHAVAQPMDRKQVVSIQNPR